MPYLPTAIRCFPLFFSRSASSNHSLKAWVIAAPVLRVGSPKEQIATVSPLLAMEAICSADRQMPPRRAVSTISPSPDIMADRSTWGSVWSFASTTAPSLTLPCLHFHSWYPSAADSWNFSEAMPIGCRSWVNGSTTTSANPRGLDAHDRYILPINFLRKCGSKGWHSNQDWDGIPSNRGLPSRCLQYLLQDHLMVPVGHCLRPGLLTRGGVQAALQVGLQRGQGTQRTGILGGPGPGLQGHSASFPSSTAESKELLLFQILPRRSQCASQHGPLGDQTSNTETGTSPVVYIPGGVPSHGFSLQNVSVLPMGFRIQLGRAQ